MINLNLINLNLMSLDLMNLDLKLLDLIDPDLWIWINGSMDLYWIWL
jgi:hypothetical protein